MRLAASTSTRVRTGEVSAYVGKGNVEFVRGVRRTIGRVTLSGKNGLSLLSALAKDNDLDGIDLDPTGYLKGESDQLALIPQDWTARQRDLGLAVIRSQGHYAPRGDLAALKTAMTDPVAADVVRVVSLHETWLRRPNLPQVLDAVRACDNHLAFVFAGVMDPFTSVGAADGLQELLQVAGAGGRRVELLRTDVTGIAFAAHAGSLGAVGLSTSGRHHGLPMSADQQAKYRERQRWALVFVPALACWQRGNSLGALSAFAGAGLTDCDCGPCAGRSLLRFDQGWPKQVPQDVKDDACAHDLAEWSRLAGRVLTASDPAAAWAGVCADAITTANEIAARYKVAPKLPSSLAAWANSAP
jgi:hypothetical protein